MIIIIYKYKHFLSCRLKLIFFFFEWKAIEYFSCISICCSIWEVVIIELVIEALVVLVLFGRESHTNSRRLSQIEEDPGTNFIMLETKDDGYHAFPNRSIPIFQNYSRCLFYVHSYNKTVNHLFCLPRLPSSFAVVIRCSGLSQLKRQIKRRFIRLEGAISNQDMTLQPREWGTE